MSSFFIAAAIGLPDESILLVQFVFVYGVKLTLFVDFVHNAKDNKKRFPACLHVSESFILAAIPQRVNRRFTSWGIELRSNS